MGICVISENGRRLSATRANPSEHSRCQVIKVRDFNTRYL